MGQLDWKFTEDQRDAVCKGELCPTTKCTEANITYLGMVWDGLCQNRQFCCDCGEEWEGY